MIAGELYSKSTPVLVEDRTRALKLLHRFNKTSPMDHGFTDERKSIIGELFGSMAEYKEIKPPFYCVYVSGGIANGRFVCSIYLTVSPSFLPPCIRDTTFTWARAFSLTSAARYLTLTVLTLATTCFLRRTFNCTPPHIPSTPRYAGGASRWRVQSR